MSKNGWMDGWWLRFGEGIGMLSKKQHECRKIYPNAGPILWSIIELF